jgi:hypothetical protein
MARHRALDGLAEVVPEMPAVGDLDRLRCAAGGAIGVGAGPVPADDADTGMAGQPFGQGVGGAVGQQVDCPVGGQVNQHGAVVVAPAQGEVVDTDFDQLGWSQGVAGHELVGDVQLVASPFGARDLEVDNAEPVALDRWKPAGQAAGHFPCHVEASIDHVGRCSWDADVDSFQPHPHGRDYRGLAVEFVARPAGMGTDQLERRFASDR